MMTFELLTRVHEKVSRDGSFFLYHTRSVLFRVSSPCPTLVSLICRIARAIVAEKE